METRWVNLGDLRRCWGCAWQLGEWPGLTQESEGLVVPEKPVRAGGGKGPWFWVRFTELTVGRLT